ncbi:MAG: hypothetical protein Q4F54_04825 [Coriobacteriia bacterium]|nr:hypothetical protein [Coriobacteriia bacterium]
MPANFGAVATNLDNVFSDCYELLNINFAEGSKFGMASQTSENFRCDHMCIECYKLRSIDLSNFKIPNSYTPENMFVDANDISEFKISDK